MTIFARGPGLGVGGRPYGARGTVDGRVRAGEHAASTSPGGLRGRATFPIAPAVCSSSPNERSANPTADHNTRDQELIAGVAVMIRYFQGSRTRGMAPSRSIASRSTRSRTGSRSQVGPEPTAYPVRRDRLRSPEVDSKWSVGAKRGFVPSRSRRRRGRPPTRAAEYTPVRAEAAAQRSRSPWLSEDTPRPAPSRPSVEDEPAPERPCGHARSPCEAPRGSTGGTTRHRSRARPARREPGAASSGGASRRCRGRALART